MEIDLPEKAGFDIIKKLRDKNVIGYVLKSKLKEIYFFMSYLLITFYVCLSK